jgi:DNA-binding response OmpR family regulator
MSRVLVVDDEKLIVKGLKFALEQDGMEVDCAYDGQEAVDLAHAGDYDIILLDVMLPKLTGYEVCQTIRETSDVPIIMLTAKSDDNDKIQGLEYGADDYITKPFNILEVKARIKAIQRRMTGRREDSRKGDITCGELHMDTDARRVTLGEREVRLTSKEFDILKLLLCNPGKIYSRDDLLHAIWGSGTPADARTVDVHVRRLREKIEEDPGEPRYVFTKWGSGYYNKR